VGGADGSFLLLRQPIRGGLKRFKSEGSRWIKKAGALT